MPIFDFECPNCEKTFESITSPYEPVKCPMCGGFPCKKLISAHKSAWVKGDNGASVTPKKYRDASKD
jgi:putative FmdB family regulatory protein